MKKIPIWLVALLLLFMCSPLYAAAVPGQINYVNDPIGLFSTSQKSQIEEAVKGKELEVVVLTVRGLDEAAGEKLANDVYTNWKLDANKLMLVVTVDPNFVHLVYENPALANSVSNSAAQNAKGIVDRSFVPLASQGKIAEGVIAVSAYVNALQAGASTGGQGISITLILVILAVAVVLVIAIFIIFKLRRVASTRKHLEQLKGIQSKTELSISKMVNAEIFKELEGGYLQGETLKQVADVETAAMQLQQQSQQLQERLAAQQVSFTTQAAAEQSLQALEQEAQTHAQQVKEIEVRLAAIEQQSSGVRQSVEAEKARTQQLSATIEALATETSYPLTAMKQQLQQAQQLLAEADQLDDFDYVKASHPIEAATGQVDTLTEAISQLKPLIAAAPQFLPRTQALEQELRQQVGREQLMLVDADPFRMLKQAEADINRLNPLIEAGAVDEARQTATTIEETLLHAKAAVDQMVSNRDTSRATVREIEQLLSQLQEFDREYQAAFAQIQARFANVHQQEQSTRYSSIINDKQTLEALLVEIRSALDPRVQTYKLAQERSEQAKAAISQIKQAREQILGYREHLDDRLQSAAERADANKSRFYQAVSTLEQQQMDMPELHKLMANIEAGMSDQPTKNKQGLDVFEVEQQLQQHEALIDQYTHRVEQLVQEKKDTLQQLRQFQDEFVTRQNRYGGSIGLTPFSNNYTKIQIEGERLIAMGLFAEAVQQISTGRQILSQMDLAYQKAQELERQRNNRGGPGGGSGGGSGRSSGSSGWGGGGRSSGSSSWGGGSSGGGRSSGSSKW
ncbi:TPM domain-containing protein [Paenibacillus agricola]|uniref:TPM domain-containing protein n=1 Tax=Paenibacillus agricola TaxID=2716264 RepID=A0ABX0JBA1_9BACL|nr:TPM domain-containing protein [Paenibacillus agricola]NHN31005.1 TPM domain-containing protein [Paenibacillus agricola]